MATTTAPHAPVEVEVETLPDGRALHVRADGSVVVVGVAQARPHPVPGVDWIHRGATRPRLRRARRPGPVHFRPLDPDALARGGTAFTRRLAHDRANRLLRSLLDADQRAEYERTGYFWVEVPQGRLRFGRLFAIRFEPCGSNDFRLLCVVPSGYEDLPIPDIWANLLLAVRDDPARFFAVAIDRSAPPPRRTLF
ncbi:MAG: hypothetical protein ACKO72_11650 [Actinomycetes bacterium]